MSKNIGFSDCHLAEVMDDPDDPSSEGMKRPMCSFCGKKWCEIISEPSVSSYIELSIRRWGDGDLPFRELIKVIQDEYKTNFWNATHHTRKQLQKGKKPKYTYSIDSLRFMPTTSIKDTK